MSEKKKQMTIATKLIISFSLVITLFLGVVIYSNVVFTRTDSLYRYKFNYVVARQLNLLQFHQELTEIRRLFKSSFYNPVFLETADLAIWRLFEDDISASYLRMQDFAYIYIELAESDPLYFTDQATQVETMWYILDHVDAVYALFRENFFIGGNDSHYVGNVLDYTFTVEDILQDLIKMDSEASDEILLYIENTLNLSEVITIGILALVMAVTSVLAYFTVTSFTGRIKLIAENVGLVKKGDFSASLKSGAGDEISRLIADMVNIFEELIKEINDISTENGMGNTEALIDLDKFEGGYKEAASAINSLINKIKDSNDRVKFIFESIPIVLTLWDSDLEIIDYNEEVVRRFGLSKREEYRERFFDLMPEYQPDGSHSKAMVIELLSTAKDNSQQKFDFMHRNLNGDAIPTELSFFTAEYKGQPVILTCSMDMRGIYESLEREREATERMQLMFDATPLVIMYWNKDHSCIDCNQAAALFYGLGSKEDLDDRFAQYAIDVQPEGAPSTEFWHYHLDRTFENGYSKIEYVVRKGKDADSDLVFFEVICQRMRVMGDFVVVTYANDVTALKEMLKEKERIAVAEANSQAKSRFLARMSHEIRTPISAVIGIAEIQLQNHSLDGDTSEAFNKIYSSSHTLLGIVNDILDLSKIEAGKMDLLYNEYNTSSLFGDIIQMNAVNLGSKRLNFIVEIDENIPRSLMGDELRIKQVLTNILSNAFKYTEIGTVSLSIHCRKDTDNSVNLQFVVKDTGRGMTKNQLSVLFKEYTRFHEVENRFVEGTGLGMPIVYNLSQLMGATIDVESMVRVGTVVTVNLPQQVIDPEVIGPTTVKSLEQFEIGGRAKESAFTPEPMPYGRVLVVDDVETNRYVAKGLLSFYSINVETVNTGQEAVNRVKSGEEYDVIFMDHMMPGLNGIDATLILRDMGYSKPIVALTANALVGQAEEFLRNGFDGFIPKPIQTAQLHDTLVKFVKRQESVDAQKDEQEEIDGYYDRPEVQALIRQDFGQSQKDAMVDLLEALRSGDVETAVRIAHTLKSLGRYMREESLSHAAGKVEEALSGGGVSPDVLDGALDSLNGEFYRVLEGLDS